MRQYLYHGSDHIVGQPKYGEGKLHNDYGKGFYCTEDISLAREWAVDRDRDGYVNIYEIDDGDLQILNLEEDCYNGLHWIEILLNNRNFSLNYPMAVAAADYLHKYFHVNVDDYDVVIGYRADDSYFSYARAFVNGNIGLNQLCDSLRLGELGVQYVLKSKKAFDQIKYIGSEHVNSYEWFAKKDARDKHAREAYKNMDVMKYIKTDIYINKKIEEEMRADDPRLQ